MKTIIKQGDVVKQKNSKQQMVVEKVLNGKILCVWFDDDDKLHKEEFQMSEIEI